MREQLKRAGHPAPSVIGVDEISIKNGHSYRIVVSDLEARRAIWFGEFAGEQGVPFIHSGSRVWLFPKAGIIAYAKPKRSIAGAVKPGDILFKGRIGAGEITGTAYVFKAGCAPAPYPVNGSGFRGRGQPQRTKR